MDLTFSTPLKGNLVLCSDYRDAALHRSPGLYKFVWVRRGCLWLEVDHIPMELRAGMLLPLTPLHTLDVTRAEGEYLILAFDSNFYCIFGHDGEVSCSGLLFNGSSEVLRLELSEMRTAALQRVVDDLRAEYGVVDGLREEMLRMQLKRFIIICTRIAREHFSVGADREKLFDTVRRYYVLVDEHFRTKKRVQDGQPSPLNIIHDRVNAEARRLLLYTPKSAKEIAYLLGYEDTAAFSRFFAKMNGESITGFRQREKRE